jgi:hypothetical protein
MSLPFYKQSQGEDFAEEPPETIELSDIGILVVETERGYGPTPEMDLPKSNLVFDSSVDY